MGALVQFNAHPASSSLRASTLCVVIPFPGMHRGRAYWTENHLVLFEYFNRCRGMDEEQATARVREGYHIGRIVPGEEPFAAAMRMGCEVQEHWGADQ